MRSFYLAGALVLIFVGSALPVLSQQREKNPYPTSNTTTDPKPDPKKQKPKDKRLRYIVRPDTKETLTGNLCFEEQTRKMGFQYLAVAKGQAPYTSGWQRFWHNFGVKTILVLKNGPFWKSRVNKAYKACKFGSGDFVG
jgi:hypothetical protein